MLDAFKAAIERSHAKAVEESGTGAVGQWQGGHIDSLVGATALTSVLERTSMYHAWIAEMGGSREALVETTATFMQSLLASKR